MFLFSWQLNDVLKSSTRSSCREFRTKNLTTFLHHMMRYIPKNKESIDHSRVLLWWKERSIIKTYRGWQERKLERDIGRWLGLNSLLSEASGALSRYIEATMVGVFSKVCVWDHGKDGLLSHYKALSFPRSCDRNHVEHQVPFTSRA